MKAEIIDVRLQDSDVVEIDAIVNFILIDILITKKIPCCCKISEKAMLGFFICQITGYRVGIFSISLSITFSQSVIIGKEG